jgi:hypothetical protein
MENTYPSILKPLNVAKKDAGAFATLLGEAHQYLVTGILMRLGFLVFVSTVRAGTFDLIIPVFENFSKEKEKNILLRAQVKTVSDSMRFIGGTRAGVDRVYKPGVKEYKYTTKHNDMIIGIDPKTLDLYFVPTRFIDKWGKSVSKRKLGPLKNNMEILLNWNDSFLNQLRSTL